MPHLRCTRKLLSAIGCSQAAEAVEAKPVPTLGDWYANLLVISRKRVLLFTNEPTLYSFAVAGVRKAALPSLTRMFLEHLARNLADDHLPADVIQRLTGEYRNLEIAGTANRSVVGSMNDLANLLEHHVRDAGGVAGCDVRAINRQLNRTPHKPLGWKFAAEALQERLLGVFIVPGPRPSRVFLN